MKVTKIIFLTGTLVLSLYFAGCYTTFAVTRHSESYNNIELDNNEFEYVEEECALQVIQPVVHLPVDSNPVPQNERRDFPKRETITDRESNNIRRPSTDSGRQSVANDKDKIKSEKKRNHK